MGLQVNNKHVVMYTVCYMHVFLHKYFNHHTENLRRVDYLQDGPSPLGLVGGVATIGVLHFQQLSKGVQRCTKVSRGAQRCAGMCKGVQICAEVRKQCVDVN